MVFLDINLTKDSSLLLENQYPALVLKILTKKPAKQETQVYSWIAFCRMEKWGKITIQVLESEKTRIYVQKPAVQEYHLCILDVYVRLGWHGRCPQKWINDAKTRKGLQVGSVHCEKARPKQLAFRLCETVYEAWAPFMPWNNLGNTRFS
jgi:hypothetical protein